MCLLSLLIHYDAEEVCGYFTENFHLGRKYVDPRRCLPIVSGIKSKTDTNVEQLELSRREYEKFKTSLGDSTEHRNDLP